MRSGELKYRSLRLIQTTRPNPCLVTLAVLAFSWLVNWITQRIGGQPFYIDMDALANMDIENAYGMDWGLVTPVSAAFFLAFEALSILLNFGYNRYCLNVCREQKCGFYDLLAGFELPLKALVLWILTRLVTMLLTFLLIVPGIIAAYMYSMATRLLCDHPDWSPVRCMRESRQMMRGHKWELFTIHLSFLGWMILSVIPAVSVFTDPYILLSETNYYLALSDWTPPEEEEPEEKPPWEY